ncbi:peptidase S41 [bacterium]|nr:peptidase S41 [bacterium]
MKNFFEKRYIQVILLLAMFVLGYFIGQTNNDSLGQIKLNHTESPEWQLKTEELKKEVDMSLFWDTWQLLEEKYVDSNELDEQDMIYGAIKGMVNSLNDPYSLFMTPEETMQFLQDMEGSFEGIGAEVGIRGGVLTIIAPLRGMPAEKAGLRAGDKVIKVDETLTADLTLDQAVRLIRGPRGTQVVLTVVRTDNGLDTHEIIITRAKIDIPSVEWEIKQGNIAYISLSQFSEDTEKEFKKISKNIINSNANKIILDLRNNPGGYLNVAIDLAGYFLPKDYLVVTEDYGGKTENLEHKTSGKGELQNYDIVILINQGSASASEILAGAIQEHRGVKLIGKKTFGKGSVQELSSLKNDSALRVTVAKWLLPSGINIHEQGIDPDIEIEITPDDYDKNKDPQLEKAINILQSMDK